MAKKVSDNPLYGMFDDVLHAVLKVPQPLDSSTRGGFWEGLEKLKYIDLFCGIGGFHLAAESLGLECVFASDIDQECRNTYKANFGIEPKGDISLINARNIPDHDILFAGFPCQPFSIIGDRKGFEDVRGTLFFELARIIEAKEPRAFILENVRQLSTHNKGKTLARIVTVLEELGYTVEKKILNALHFGLPQKRERILIVGFKGQVSDFDWPTHKIPMIPLSEVLERSPDKRYFVSERIKRSRHSEHAAKHKPSVWHENKAGNVSSHPFSCALRAGASYNYLLVDGERRLTPREMLRLQGFPDSFKIASNDSQARKQAGNAVPVPMVKAVLERVLHAERADKAQRKSAAA